ncbi:hypothetical protein HK098_006836 [Nowakowskiella sp. JEL0407]|nr:hypothetical protein HK098_006836 [Nowakowskiella sp. JEL0407]
MILKHSIPVLYLLLNLVKGLTIQPETGTLTGVNVLTEIPYFTGTGAVGWFDAADKSDLIYFNLTDPAQYHLNLRYYTTENSTILLEINDVPYNFTLVKDTPAGVIQGVPQQNGDATGFFTAYLGKFDLKVNNKMVIKWQSGSFAVDAVFVSLVVPLTLFDAEGGVLNGNCKVGNTVKGFVGPGYVEGFTTPDDSVTVTFNNTLSKYFNIQLRYNAPDSDVTATVLVGTNSTQIQLLQTKPNVNDGIWQVSTVEQLYLAVGSYDIVVKGVQGNLLLDLIMIEDVQVGPHDITAITDALASDKTKQLYNLLKKIFGKYTLSGQFQLDNLNYIISKIGPTPAILGLDFILDSPNVQNYGGGSKPVFEAVDWDAKGGIVSYSWSWIAPTGLFNTPTNPWFTGFTRNSTDFNVTLALDPQNANYTLLIRDIDAIATQLTQLSVNNVPVLFRPIRACHSGLFWWASDGPETCKNLYKLIVNRLRTFHKLNNLIFVWDSQGADYYPGHDVVDVLGYNQLIDQKDPTSNFIFRSMSELTHDNKILAITECSQTYNLDAANSTDTTWAYMMSAFTPSTDTSDYLKKFYTQNNVLTADEVVGWTNGSDPVIKPVVILGTATTTVSSTTTTTVSGSPKTSATAKLTPTASPTVVPSGAGSMFKFGVAEKVTGVLGVLMVLVILG